MIGKRIAEEVTVLIPAFNAENFIKEAIDSIQNQTILPGEIIVINDGSSDDTSNFIRKLNVARLRVIEQEQQGVAAALNLGIAKSKGEILAFLDHDDLWLEDKLEKQLEAMQNHQVDMVFTLIENFLDPAIDIDLSKKLKVNLNPFVGIHKSTWIIKKESFQRVGIFDKENKIELLDWYARSKDLGVTEHIVNQVMVKRRIHGTNQSILDDDLRNEFPRILKSILDRRRGR